MSYYKMTQDELFAALKHIDAKIAAYPPSLGGGEYLQQERDEIIGIFVEFYGYNPDNLVTSAKLDDVVVRAQGNTNIYPYTL